VLRFQVQEHFRSPKRKTAAMDAINVERIV